MTSFDPELLAAKLLREAEASQASITEARAAVAPLEVTDPDELVAITITIDLAVTKVRLHPHAHRDLQKLEDVLATTMTEAITQARAADPALNRLNRLTEVAQEDLQERLAETQQQLSATMQKAEARMGELQRKLAEHRARASQARQQSGQ